MNEQLVSRNQFHSMIEKPLTLMKLEFNFKIKIVYMHNHDSMTEISLADSWKFKSNTNF